MYEIYVSTQGECQLCLNEKVQNNVQARKNCLNKKTDIGQGSYHKARYKLFKGFLGCHFGEK